ncbi:MAG TPA: LamG-like jellyroll fold domain-containing protein [Pirellulales bacterium]|jgi:hypothetical protein
MSQSAQEFAELEQLCAALVDGRLTDAQQRRLNRSLAESESARQFYVRYLDLATSLHEYADPSPVAFVSEPGENLPPRTKDRHFLSRKLVGWSAALLSVSAAVLLGVFLSNRTSVDDSLPASDAEIEQIAAQITGLKDCRWTQPASPLVPSDVLHEGQQLELAAGIAEITFDSGARITLEGPASLIINSAWAATLGHGKLTAEVPHEAIGFRATSSTVDVVDLGTQFCMQVDSDGATDVGVIEGSVEATPRTAATAPQSPVVLQQRRARRFQREGNEEIENAAVVFDRFAKPAAMQRVTRPVSYIHWSFDRADNRIVPADYGGPWAKKSDLKFEPPLENESSLQHIAGRWGDALQLDSQSTAKAVVPGLSNHATHTLAAWVKIPAAAPLTSANSFISWATTDANETVSQSVRIGWNTNPEQGPLGALKTEIGRVNAIGTTDLRDDKWHHVAIVLSPHKRWDVKQYVDGHLERGATKVFKRRREIVAGEPADDVIRIGLPFAPPRDSKQAFHPALDELFISDHLLTPQQITQLIKSNELVSAASPTTDSL